LAAHILAEYSDVKLDRIEALFAEQAGYATPKVDVRGAVFREVEVLKLAAVYDRDRHGHEPLHAFHVYKLLFVCKVTGGAARPGLETSEVRFFTIDELPSDLSRARVRRHQLDRMFEHWGSPGLPTEFD
jgi:ADP-ribose pyrophosphatase YjhB (NUDIX family)